MEKSSTNVIETAHNRSSKLRHVGTSQRITREQAEEAGRIIRAARKNRGLSEQEFATQVGITQVALNKIERGITRESKALPLIVHRLEVDLSGLGYFMPSIVVPANGHARAKTVPAESGFRIYGADELSAGEFVRSPEPVDWRQPPEQLARVRGAYGLYVAGDTMTPEYRPGDVALINPHLPIIVGEVYVFYDDPKALRRATIRVLRRVTAEKWHVAQYNKPKDFDLSRKEWQGAHRVIGKYRGIR